jgi:glycine cleavage system protein P-like pyridoxal-binding family
VLNANYIRAKLSDVYAVPIDRINMHECLLSGSRQKKLACARSTSPSACSTKASTRRPSTSR